MSSEDMGPGEVARRLEDVVREVRLIADRSLLKEVYEAQKAGFEMRIVSLESDRQAMRKLVYTLLGTFLVGVAVQIFVVLTHH